MDVEVPSAAAIVKEARASVGLVSAAFSEMVSELPSVRRPADLRRLLGIDYGTSWRVVRVAGASDPLGVASAVPRPGSVSRLLSSAAARGVRDLTIERVRLAVEAHEALAVRHGGERSVFDAMLCSLAPEVGPGVDLDAKRAAYRANVLLYRRQIDATFGCQILRRAPDGADGGLRVEYVWLSGVIGLTRFDPSAALLLAKTEVHHDTRAEREVNRRLAVGGEQVDSPEGLLLRQFCSDRLPAVRMEEDVRTGVRSYSFDSNGLGVGACMSFVIGERQRPVECDLDGSGRPVWRTGAKRASPAGVGMTDLFVDPALVEHPSARVFVVGGVANEYDYEQPDDQRHRFPVQERAEVAGRGPGAAVCDEVPRYGEMLEWAFDSVGWEGRERYALLRCRVDYPVLHTTTLVEMSI